MKKNVLITGCSSGFGLASAVTLARNGFEVFATMRNPAKSGRLQEALAKAGAKAEVLALDVTSQSSIDAAVGTVVERAGRIDALVNNAGAAIGGFAEDLTMEEFRRQFETNFFGLVAVTKAVLPQLRRQRSGRIVNVSSIGGRCAAPVLTAYQASKFAVEGFSESLSFEAALFDVQVVIIEPGAFKTEIFEGNRELAAGARDPASPYFAATQHLEKKVDELVARTGADPQRVADVILHALTTPHPRLRYPVGTDARLMLAVRGIAFSAYAAMIKQTLGLGRARELLLRKGSPAG